VLYFAFVVLKKEMNGEGCSEECCSERDVRATCLFVSSVIIARAFREAPSGVKKILVMK